MALPFPMRTSKHQLLSIWGIGNSFTVVEMNYYPTRFPERPNVYAELYARLARLDLPFPAEDFDGVVFADDL